MWSIIEEEGCEGEKSILGLRWNPVTDHIHYNLSNIPTQKEWTKRQILSEIGKLYDPCGFISPIVVLAKIHMQNLWKLEIDWDETTPEEISSTWNNFLTSFNETNITIPRWLRTTQMNHNELHGFSDASEKAYAAVIYMKSTDETGKCTTTLVCAKTRVAPLKQLTIPRLELCAAHLLVKLMKNISETLTNIDETHYWTDSRIVQHWIKTPPSQLKTFVANRVSSIQELSENHSWRWIPTSDNPADLASALKNKPIMVEWPILVESRRILLAKRTH